MFYLATKKADVVIAPVVVNRYEQCRAQTGEEFRTKRECSSGKIKGQFWIEVRNACKDYPGDCQHHSHPKKLCQPFDQSNAAVEQEDCNGESGDCHHLYRNRIDLDIA